MSRKSLHKKTRVSECSLWDIQNQYFKRRGFEPWANHAIPSFVTSNALTAHAYAQLVCAYAKDLLSKRKLSKGDTLYVVDIGAGSGQLSFYMIQQLFQKGLVADLGINVIFVMTDYTQKTLNVWKKLPQLKAHIEQGHVDMATFDAIHDTSISLQFSGKTLGTRSHKAPMVFITTYIFDSISHDTFKYKHGQLYEGLVTVKGASQVYRRIAQKKPFNLNQLDLKYTYEPCDQNYYPNPAWNTLLRTCATGDHTFTFPVSGLKLVDTLHTLSKGQWLLINGDMRIHDPHTHYQLPAEHMNKHSSVSFGVNYHVFKAYADSLNGFYMEDALPTTNLSTFCLGSGMKTTPHLSDRFQATINQQGPDSFFQFFKSIKRHQGDLTIETMYTLLKESHWDLTVFNHLAQKLIEVASHYHPIAIERLGIILDHIYDHDIPLVNFTPLPKLLGVLNGFTQRYSRTLHYLALAEKQDKQDAEVHFNRALTYFNMNQLSKATQSLAKTLAINSRHPGARSLKTILTLPKRSDTDKLAHVLSSQRLEGQVSTLGQAHTYSLSQTLTAIRQRRYRLNKLHDHVDTLSWTYEWLSDKSRHTLVLCDNASAPLGGLSLKIDAEKRGLATLFSTTCTDRQEVETDLLNILCHSLFTRFKLSSLHISVFHQDTSLPKLLKSFGFKKYPSTLPHYESWIYTKTG